MGAAPSQRWFVRVNGNVSGPFTPEQIEGFLKGGKLRPSDQIASESNPTAWFALDQVVKRKAVPSFQPPPRPAELDRAALDPEIFSDPERTNPALTLFNTLQAARDRKPRPEPTAEPQPVPYRRDGVPTEVWLGLAVVLVTVLFGFGIFKTLNKEAPIPSKANERPIAERPVSPPPAPLQKSQEPIRTVEAPRPARISPSNSHGSGTGARLAAPAARAPIAVPPPEPPREDPRDEEPASAGNGDDRQGTATSGTSDIDLTNDVVVNSDTPAPAAPAPESPSDANAPAAGAHPAEVTE